MDEKVASVRRGATASASLSLSRAGVDMTQPFRPHDRRVLAHDPSTWAYLTLDDWKPRAGLR